MHWDHKRRRSLFCMSLGCFASEVARSISTQQPTHVIRYKHNTTENNFRTSLFSRCSVRNCFVSMRSGFRASACSGMWMNQHPFPVSGSNHFGCYRHGQSNSTSVETLLCSWVWWLFQHLNCYDLLLPSVWFHFNQFQDRRVPFGSFSASQLHKDVTQMGRCIYSLHFQMFVRDSFWDTWVSRLGLSLSSQASPVRERSCGRCVRLYL